MARRVFFSFHYKNDVTRANVVRNSWVTQGREAAGFVDAADFEKVKQQGDAAVERWIDNQLNNTSVTVVLLGSQTSSRKYVKYEIAQSIARGNGLLEIDVSKIKDWNGTTDFCGWMLDKAYSKYAWNNDDGYRNLGSWIEKAAKAVNR